MYLFQIIAIQESFKVAHLHNCFEEMIILTQFLRCIDVSKASIPQNLILRGGPFDTWDGAMVFLHN